MVVLKINAVIVSIRFLLVLILFLVSVSAHAQQTESNKSSPGADVVRTSPAAKNSNASLTPEEQNWLSQHDGAIRIGITVIPPEVLHENGKYEGLAIDYIHLIEHKLGYRSELVPYATWNEVIQAAKVHQIDVIFAAQQTPQRLNYLLFTEPYIELSNIILVRKDRPGGSNLKEMNGWSVAVSEGSAVEEYLKTEFAFLDLRPVQDELSGLMKVSIGEVDAMVVEISRASYYIEKAGISNLRVAGDADFIYRLRFAVRNDWPILRDILDKGLSSITDIEKLDITQRWIVIGNRSIFASRIFWISFSAGLGLVMLMVGGIIVWNLALRRKVKQRTSQLQQELVQRKQTEASLRKSEAHYRSIFDNSLIGVTVTDRNFIFTDANEAFCKMLEYPKEELIGNMTISDVSHPDDTVKSMEMINKLIRHDVDHYTIEKRYISKTGKTILSLVCVRGHYNSQGEYEGTTASSLDITERKQAEDEREILQEQLTQAQKMESVGQLAGGVAHDFNNMLGVILGHAEMAMDQVDPAVTLYADLEEIQKAAQRSADITRQLLAFARKQTITPKVLNLNETIEGLLNMLRRLIGENIDLVWIPGPDLWEIKADQSQVSQIMTNLCVNARDAITNVGKITVETGNIIIDNDYCSTHPGSVAGKYVRMSVRDNGSGMDDLTLNHIFEPFFTSKGVGQGTGLGLSMVYGAVKQNSGYIDVSSKQGQGTVFTIYFPRHEMAKAIASEEGTNECIEGLEGAECKTILLVEDEPKILKLTKMMLQDLGYTVLAASTPDEAIRLAGEYTDEIHLLMTDVIMPGMNGRSLAEQLLVNHQGMGCLFMSGYTSDIITNQGVLDVGVHFIQKPFSKNELATKISVVLKKERLDL